VSIRGNTTTGAAAGASAGMHLSTDFPSSPTGADTKSTAIAGELNAFLKTAQLETTTYNTSVDTLREGLVAAPQAVDATDAAGAAGIEGSGEVYTI